MKKRYIDGLFGQVHLLETAGPALLEAPPLVCLHATAYSSQTFKPLLAAFGDERKLIALDTPGYGGSDRPETPPDLAGYADALADSVGRLADGPVDVLGYHTGAYIAAEAAIRHPGLFRKFIMIGVPFFHGADRENWAEKLAFRHTLTTELQQFAERWAYFIDDRPPALALERAFENFVDEIRAWPHGSWAHEALFAYDDLSRLPLLKIPTLVLNPPGHLAEGSRRAASLMPIATVREMPDLKAPIFETAAYLLKREIAAYLDA